MCTWALCLCDTDATFDFCRLFSDVGLKASDAMILPSMVPGKKSALLYLLVNGALKCQLTLRVVFQKV